jgi:hypothetical protein
MSETETKPCPSCGVPVAVKVEVCPSCGVNIRTGETYESRVQRAKGKELHPEHFSQGMYAGMALVFMIVMVAGFLYQRPTERVLRANYENFVTTFQTVGRPMHYLQALMEIDALAAAGEKEKAQALADEAIKSAGEQINQIDQKVIETLKRSDKGLSWSERSEYSARKRILRGIIGKAEFKRSQIGKGG